LRRLLGSKNCRSDKRERSDWKTQTFHGFLPVAVQGGPEVVCCEPQESVPSAFVSSGCEAACQEVHRCLFCLVFIFGLGEEFGGHPFELENC
jgi:hypothetical protein